MTEEARKIVATLRYCDPFSDNNAKCSECPTAGKYCIKKNGTIIQIAANLIEHFASVAENSSVRAVVCDFALEAGSKLQAQFNEMVTKCHSLESQLDRVTRELNAAVEDLKGICDFCAHMKTCTGHWCTDCDEFDECKSPCKNCEVTDNWQWRGIEDE